MTGAQIVIECLLEQGVDTIFGYPGGTVLNIYDQLFKNSSRIRHILTAHEQGAAHAADGYARSSGRTGVVLATSGPGATNLVTGLATAYMDSIPLVAITGNVPSHLLGRDSFQEVDITGITMPITKHNFIVRKVEDLADSLRKAFIIAGSGRCGPVLVDIPKDLTVQECEWKAASPEHLAALRSALDLKSSPHPTAASLQQAADLIRQAKRPLLYAGGGVIASAASAELRTLAERILSPVALSLMGHGAFPANHPLCTGLIGMHGTKASNMAASQADLIVALGARFSDRVTSNTQRFAPGAQILHIDIDPAEINKNIQSYHSLKGDVKQVLRLLLDLIPQREVSAWNGDIKDWKAIHPSSHEPGRHLHPRYIMEETHTKVPADTIITTEVGQHQMWTAQFYPFSKPRTFLSSGGLGTMGFGTGAAIGAQVANPDRQVVHFAGDGSFRMNCTELATIAHYKLPVLIVVMNNGCLGMVRQWQKLFYEGRYSETTLDRGPDFLKLADAYGLPAWRAGTEGEFTAALNEALSERRPALIECIIESDEDVLPIVPSGKPIEEQILETVKM